MPKATDTATKCSMLWQKARQLASPGDYWNGQRLADTLLPDNILVFPYSRPAPSMKESYGNYHPRFVLDICLGGEALYHLAGTDYRMACGEAVLAFPHEAHGIHPAERGKPLSRWLIATFELKGSQAVAALRETPRQLGQRELDLVEALQSACEEGDPLFLSAALARLLRALCDAPLLPASRRQPLVAQPEQSRFLAMIDRHLDDYTTLADLARTTGCSEHQLKVSFRKYTQSTPADYIRRTRLAKAARLLQRGEKSITEIAEHFGFSSVYAFSRMFKTVYGLPPKEYEKLGRETGLSCAPTAAKLQ